ncbi:TetR/AcrR family transcriptional regulator [Mycobacterium talmoniae]|uniref:TetR/AcrR family transcriptional regulator n=1 Tax=Mycobacterium talmoniae TaxID=1858794 RepID=UPI001F612412|nr:MULTISPECIES: TetR/AcrR family transcriptional regulator [Mycobacterium]
MRTTTRKKMLSSAVELLRERGAAGVTIDAVLSRSKSPRGSVYHHFPGGRNEIMTESLALAGDAIGDFIERAAADGSVEALHRFGEFWAKMLRDSDFGAGCPVVSVAVGGSTDDQHLLPTVAAIFDRWHRALADRLVADGVAAPRADRLATLVVAGVEGAVILCRVHRSTGPLDDVITEFEELFGSLTPPTDAKR